jgi:hypothetical protein
MWNEFIWFMKGPNGWLFVCFSILYTALDVQVSNCTTIREYLPTRVRTQQACVCSSRRTLHCRSSLLRVQMLKYKSARQAGAD